MRQIWLGPWLACIVVAVVVFGCEDTPRGVAESEVVDAFVEDFCGPMFSCNCDDQMRYPSREECRRQVQEGFERVRQDAAGLAYDPLCYGAILDAVDSLGCGPSPGAQEDDCVPACSPYHGDRREGSPCEARISGISDCAQGLMCVGSVCTDPCGRGSRDEPCGARGCHDGLWCDFGDSPATCRAAGAEDESCADRPCAEALWCDGESNRCRSLPGPGEPCSPRGCREGTFCDASDPNADPICRAPGQRGDPCMGHAQCMTNYCPAGFCADIPREGESCAGTLVCAEGLMCREDVCIPSRPAICGLSVPWPHVN
jgi:hypothetical protein